MDVRYYLMTARYHLSFFFFVILRGQVTWWESLSIPFHSFNYASLPFDKVNRRNHRGGLGGLSIIVCSSALIALEELRSNAS